MFRPWRVFLSGFVFGFLLIWPNLSSAAEPAFEVGELKVQVEVTSRGEVLVNKVFELSEESEVFFWVLDGAFKDLKIFAEEKPLGEHDFQFLSERGRYYLYASAPFPAARWRLFYSAPLAISQVEQDNFNLILVSEPDIFVKNLEAKVVLPFRIVPEEIEQRVYAIHGVQQSSYRLLPPRTLLYQGEDLLPYATFTISASWPSGKITYPFFWRLLFFLERERFPLWVLLSIILPSLAILFYLSMFFIRRKDQRLPLSIREDPPEDLPPAVVGVLLRERASSLEIASTILDLARRGFLDIVKKRKEYVLGKRRGKGTLRPFEAYLYEKLFSQQGEIKVKRTEFELEKRAKEQLFSSKISYFFEALYREVRKRNYFFQNPEAVILKYKTAGIGFFGLALFTAVLGLRFSGESPYPLLGSFGQLVASLIIIRTAGLMPKRTREGRRALLEWLAFRNYLVEKRPIQASPSQFIEYLPYAFTFGKEIEWSTRFANTPFTAPSWFVAEEEITLEDFVSNLFYITGSLSNLLYTLKEPAV